ncbi:acetolactate synthase small subunit [Corynebacterium phoceense]|uniref:acetolactate synthase small subunit n=1 Tax=Corynebacterium TaxID=1716 RepID=UPI00079751C6|nr:MULTISPECIES: acetolactate synthase small subunit [Corynebacterium]KXB52033.1 acetolactate synthase, small subunit [Corynebacterium sp. DNF00584]KXI19708.1 acetolactate synthase, small subunit [Corynebacterium sp. CMW7794]MBF9010550.1 acetolactate synthase small subunit [Corynebacterium phoceense]MCQ9334732.1 acetolactate synthase small subunit [Corynebacterium phoceense]MCQ9335474.1 acetolactate synthase small subunit [Corynebacterium phoceense]
MAATDITRHTLSVLVQDVEGIISRVTGMFSRRGYNLISLVSAKTEVEGINRLTIVVDANDIVTEQVTKQLNKLIHVLKVVELDEETTISRAIMLVKVSANNDNRAQVVGAVDIFRARVVDVAPESVVIEATGTPGKLRALLDVLEPFGIRELIQSGRVALGRGPKSMAPTK